MKQLGFELIIYEEHILSALNSIDHGLSLGHRKIFANVWSMV
jgi:hypothetical protein